MIKACAYMILDSSVVRKHKVSFEFLVYDLVAK